MTKGVLRNLGERGGTEQPKEVFLLLVQNVHFNFGYSTWIFWILISFTLTICISILSLLWEYCSELGQRNEKSAFLVSCGPESLNNFFFQT